MSAAMPPKRPMPAARPAAAAAGAHRPMRAAPGAWLQDDEPEFRLHLADIPRMRESLHVEGLKPTLLSRLFDLIAPLKP